MNWVEWLLITYPIAGISAWVYVSYKYYQHYGVVELTLLDCIAHLLTGWFSLIGYVIIDIHFWMKENKMSITIKRKDK